MPGRWIHRVIVLVVVVACIAATVLLTQVAAKRHIDRQLAAAQEPGPPTPIFDLPDFQFTNQLGQPFGSKDLHGHIWIAHFFYSRCTTICPMVTGQMARLQQFLQEHHLDDVRLVSFTVDPDNDTVQKLAEYAHRMNADPQHWAMLTGPQQDIWRLIEDGFKLAVARTGDPNNPIQHSASLVLVDGQGRVCRYYHDMNVQAQAEKNFELLAKDLAQLGAESKP